MGRKYQQEIEELLAQVGEGSSDQAREQHRQREGILRGRRLRLRGFPQPSRLFFLSLGLLILALVLKVASLSIWAPIAWVALSVFLVGYISFFLRPRRPFEKRWRGRPLD